MRIRIKLYKNLYKITSGRVFWSWKRPKRLPKSKEKPWSWSNLIFLNKITITTNFLALFLFFFPWTFLSWIRIRKLNADPDPGGKSLRMHSDPDPQPWFPLPFVAVTTEDWFNEDKARTKMPQTSTESSAGKQANQTLPDTVFKNYDDFYYDIESAGLKTR